jgi:hypothetical protein
MICEDMKFDIQRTKCCHLPILNFNHNRIAVYFDASWCRRSNLETNEDIIAAVGSAGLSTLYYIPLECCDEVCIMTS